MPRPLAGLALLLTLASLPVGPSALRAQPRVDPSEVRGLWVVRTSLTSAASIARMVESAQAAGFNALLVQVRGRGDAFYAGGTEPRAAALAAQPAGFDPLATTLAEAHARGMRVFAWINVNLVSSAHDLPSSPSHIVNRAPDWLMVPRALAQELSIASPTSPGYVGRIARWVRSRSDQVEGLYASPLHPAAADHVVRLVADLAERYDIDGVHFDYVRFPAPDFDYSPAALEAFRSTVAPTLPPGTADLLARRAAGDVLAYVDALPERWADFRRTRLTGLMRRLREAVLGVRPDAVITAAVVADPGQAAQSKLQDWRRWLDMGLIDVACPMAYTTEDAVFAAQIADAVASTTAGAIWAGIGAYRLSADQTVARISAARRAGVDGVVLFSYDSLLEAAPAGTHLSEIGRAAFTETPASTGGR